MAERKVSTTLACNWRHNKAILKFQSTEFSRASSSIQSPWNHSQICKCNWTFFWKCNLGVFHLRNSILEFAFHVKNKTESKVSIKHRKLSADENLPRRSNFWGFEGNIPSTKLTRLNKKQKFSEVYFFTINYLLH